MAVNTKLEVAAADGDPAVHIGQKPKHTAFVFIGLCRCKCVRKVYISGRFAVLNDSCRKVAAALSALAIFVIAGVLALGNGNVKGIGIELIAFQLELYAVRSGIGHRKVHCRKTLVHIFIRSDRSFFYNRTVFLFKCHIDNIAPPSSDRGNDKFHILGVFL